MKKSELIKRVAQKNPHLTIKDIDAIMDVILDCIRQTLVDGNRVEFRGFGTFSVRSRSSRLAKNPKTGDSFMIAERRTIHFKTGRELFAKINS